MKAEILRAVYQSDATPETVDLHTAGLAMLLNASIPEDWDVFTMNPEKQVFLGMTVTLDPRLPPGTVELRQGDRLMRRIVNLT